MNRSDDLIYRVNHSYVDCTTSYTGGYTLAYCGAEYKCEYCGRYGPWGKSCEGCGAQVTPVRGKIA